MLYLPVGVYCGIALWKPLPSFWQLSSWLVSFCQPKDPELGSAVDHAEMKDPIKLDELVSPSVLRFGGDVGSLN